MYTQFPSCKATGNYKKPVDSKRSITLTTYYYIAVG